MIPVPEPIRAALARAHGADPARLRPFAGGREENDGVIYAYPHRERERLLKIMAIPAAERARGLFVLDERARFMRFLGDRGARVVSPVPAPDGALYATLDDDAHTWAAYVMELAPGHTVPWDMWDPALFTAWGQAVGQMHRLARDYPGWDASVDPATGARHLTWLEEWQGFAAMGMDELVAARWRSVRDRLAALPCDRTCHGFIHNDPHIANLAYDGEHVTLLDFDVANHHWFASDLAIACQSILFAHTGGMDRPLADAPRLAAFWRAFLAGYRREHDLAPEWLARLDLFIAYRRILLYTVMQGWLAGQQETRERWRRMILEEPAVVGGSLR